MEEKMNRIKRNNWLIGLSMLILCISLADLFMGVTSTELAKAAFYGGAFFLMGGGYMLIGMTD
jgi:hypothetical protein